MFFHRLVAVTVVACAMVSGQHGNNHGRSTSQQHVSNRRGASLIPARDGRSANQSGRRDASSRGRGGGRSFFAAGTNLSDLPDMGLLAPGRGDGTPSAQPQ